MVIDAIKKYPAIEEIVIGSLQVILHIFRFCFFEFLTLI